MNNNHCIVCHTHISAPLFVSEGSSSLTTMLDVLPNPTVVRYCERCGHLQTEPLEDLKAYYSQHYQILSNSEDEDQLVSLRNGQNVLRNEHQINTLLDKVPMQRGALVLDYGCAKSAALRLLTSRRTDISPHVFDVSDLYIPFWEKFIPQGQWATHQVPAHWEGRFDMLTSFFALEHVESPGLFMQEVNRLLKKDGIFYCIVPNTYDNIADFVVADHVSHFSSSSITYLLESHGFVLQHIDDQSHPGAWIFIGRKSSAEASPSLPPANARIKAQAEEMAKFWETFGSRVRSFENYHTGQPAVVYGSGFYGTYIMTCLRDPGRVLGFLDRNLHRQSQQLLNLPILAPEQVPDEVRVVYVGLNPRIAHAAMEDVAGLTEHALEFFYP